MGIELPLNHPVLSRRSFLRCALGTGVLASAAAVASPVSAAPAVADWAGLDAIMAGGVVIPTDTARFAQAKAVFNTRYDRTVPAAVVSPQTSADVARAVSFAAENRLTVSARSGGHSYVGASAANGSVIVDLRGLSSQISHDEKAQSVTVTPATTLFDLQTVLHRSGRAVPIGTCPTVGCGGLTLGGGIGTDTREFGLTCDRLTAAELVLPDGRIVSVSETQNQDLLWALRGGGGGAVGLVTSMTLRTHAATTKDLVLLGFPTDAAAEVVAAWATWLPSIDTFNWVGVSLDSDRSGGVRCGVLLICPAGTGAQLAERFVTVVGRTPNISGAQTLEPDDLLLRVAGGTATAARHGFAAGSDVVGSIDHDVAEAIVGTVRSRSAAGGAGSVIIDPIDGAVRSVRPDATAFPWRRHLAVLQWFVDVDAGDSSESATSWIADGHKAARPASVGAYVNYAEDDAPPGRYFGPNLARLLLTRAAYDPARVLCSSYPATSPRGKSSGLLGSS